MEPRPCLGSRSVLFRTAIGLIILGWTVPVTDGARGWPSAVATPIAMGSRRLAPPEKTNPNTKQRVGDNYGQLPLSFERNEGQTDSRVDFLSRGPGYSMFFSPGGEAVLVLSGSSPANRHAISSMQALIETDVASASPPRVSQMQHSPRGEAAVVRLRLAGANAEARAKGQHELPGKVNYLLGADRNQWRTGVSTFARVVYSGVYPGVDLAYYGNQRELEYDFIVHAGANPRVISLEIEGADRIEIDDQGDLVLHIGGRQVRHRKPISYQTANGTIHDIESRYELHGVSRVKFYVGAYDRRLPLIIDPVLVYSTYLGGAMGGGAADRITDVALDSAGSAYVTGYSAATNFPTTPGAYDTTPIGYDAFVTKLDAAGTVLLYSTVLGGSTTDAGWGIAVDAIGNAYVTGWTSSGDFPTTTDAYDQSSNGSDDVFVTKLDPAGAALTYSTFIGGGSYDRGLSLAIDGLGSAYVTGWTDSSNFPTTPGAFDTSGAPGAFVAKLSAAGSTLEYSTSLGGSYIEYGEGIAVDSAGSVYVTGRTYSSNFPTSPGAPDTTLNGRVDAFVTKLNPGGATLAYSTYVGGTEGDVAWDISVDVDGNAYFVGATNSVNFPTTLGTFDTSFNGFEDAFVAKLNPSGTAFVYSTFLGGTGGDSGEGIAIDVAGNAYVTGRTLSSNFPVTAGAFDMTVNGAFGSDAFVTKLAATGAVLVYSTFLGGSNEDVGYAVAVDGSGSAYVAGETCGPFPTTPGAFDRSASGCDGFVTKLTTNGSSLTYSTYLGGSIDPQFGGADRAVAIAVDAAGSAYVVGVTGSVDFPTTTGTYDAESNNGDAFVTKLDPTGTVLIYSTFLGGNGYDEGQAIALDSTGNAHITGRTSSNDFPVTTGAFDAGFNGGNWDVFVTKLDLAGATLVYSTFLGGGDFDFSEAISVDASGNAYVTGYTESGDYPVTPGAHDSTLSGPSDGFVTRVEANGASLGYSTFLGGGGYDQTRGLAVDLFGHAYVTGYTSSGDFPTTVGAYDTSYRPGFVTKLDADGAGLTYSTFLGGSYGDYPESVAVDVHGNAYVTGLAYSYDFPTTPGAYDTTYNSIFITKLDAAGANLAYSTFLGGSAYYDFVGSIAVDAAGQASVTGGTYSDDFPTTAGAPQTVWGGNFDAFVTKLDAAGASLVYSTFLGGVNEDFGEGIAVDAAGNTYVTGYTYSADFVTTAGAYDTTFNGPTDAFVARIGVAPPDERLADLEEDIGNLGLGEGPRNSLTVKLQGAAESLAAGNFSAACGKLGAFINELQAQSGKKIPAGNAAALIEEAEAIRQQIGCS